MQELIVDLGGRVAEELIFDDVTTGASQDIKQATGTCQSDGDALRYVGTPWTDQL